jgi:hypothetical protein
MVQFVAFLLLVGGMALFGWAGCAMWGMNFLWLMAGSVIVHIGAGLAKAADS